MEEQRLLDNSLTELRFRYVDAANQPPEPKAEEVSSSDPAAPNG
jgi:hypothetical protein